MVIDPGNNNINPSNTSGTAKNRRNAAPAPSSKQTKVDAPTTSSQSPDNVSLSRTGQNLAKLESQLSEAPDVDDTKVAEVRAAIANGSYTIDADRIADKMLEQDSLL